MKYLIGICVVMLIFFTNTISFAEINTKLSSSAQLTGRLKGRVMDINEGGISDVQILIQNEVDKWKVFPDKDGNYEIDLHPGVYRISANASGWLPFQRAAFQILGGDVKKINIVLVPSFANADCVFPTTDPPAKALDPIINYESISLLNSSGMMLELLIQYSDRKEYSGIIEYYGKAGVVISYDALMVYGDKVRLDKSQFKLEAEDNVIVDDGKQRIRVNRVEIKFEKGVPIIKLIK